MDNIMLDEKRKHVKLVDFGLSITFTKDDLMKTHCGSPEYAAPELFGDNHSYGPEIDIWSLGIVMYFLMVGHLPFTTPYTDHYRRTKLVQQMQKGLTEQHSKDMDPLSQDCQDILRKVVEPLPELRLSLLDMEVHPWLTNSGKLPFFPFQAFPRDKTMRSQTMVELSEKLELKKDQVEQKVGEGKSDELSAMYNMMLDIKRKEQGLFDVDHTSTLMERRDPKSKPRRAKSADDKKMVPPALVLPNPDVSVDSAPHSGNETVTEPENRMTSFDFLALCSTPTWLGPERRRSRRRGRSPNPPAHNKSNDGLSVVNCFQDYMERHGIEASHSVAGREEQHSTPSHGHHHHNNHHGHSQHHHHHHSSHSHHHGAESSSGAGAAATTSNFLSPEHAASNLSVPDVDGTHNRRHSRGSSLKLNRQRARSFGPTQRKRSFFTRSGSVDTPNQGETGRLHGAKSDTLAATSPTAVSVAAASLALAFGGQAPNLLTLQVPGVGVGPKPSPAPRPANLTLKECYSVTAEKAPKASSSLNAPQPVQDKKMAPPLAEGAVGGVRGPLTSVEVHVSDQVTPCPPVPNLVLEPPPTSVSGAGPGALSKVPVKQDKLELPSTSELPQSGDLSWSTESLLGDSDITLLPSPDLPKRTQGALAGPSNLVRPLDLLDCSQRPVFHQQVPPHALSLPKNRPAGLRQQEGEEGATAMQLGVSQAPSFPVAPLPRRPDSRDVVDSVRGRSDPIRGRGEGQEGGSGLCSGLDAGLRTLTLDGVAGATGISGNFNDDEDDEDEEDEEEEGDLELNEAEVTLEEEEEVFPADMVHVHQYLAALPKSKAVAGAVACALQHELPSPMELDEDMMLMGRASTSASASASASASVTAAATPAAVETLRRNKRGSTGSNSQASSSSRSQIRGSVPLQGGKLKTPTTPLSWMVLRSPLARIESFHSDDFEYFNSSDNDPCEQGSGASASPMSANTPTVPCFAYKLHLAKKKPPKLKKGTADNNAVGKTGKKTSAACDRGKISAASTMLEPAAHDPLLSSGSDTEHVDDSGDRAGVASKAKVHPGDKDCEKALLKGENKTSSVCNNAITQQPKRQTQQNSVNKVSKNFQGLTLEPKKKSGSKNSPWKRSFAQFLKRKRQSPRCNSSSNNNNNDCASSPMLPANHNGCSPSSPVNKVESNNVQSSLTTRAIVNNTTADLSGEVTTETGNCKARGYVPATENNISAEIPEPQSNSPAPPASPDPGVGARVFDFTLLNDSPKGRPCLLSWRPCGDCATSDVSSDDESECNPEPVVTLDLKPLGNNSVGDGSHTYLTSHECTQT
ncbi:uncharacterized protein [Littorina saxatilis]|uniref:uncharacterized protein n=1 Tax=Littorina saxatilis TaxID=31220 RepID=UPI0038B5C43D